VAFAVLGAGLLAVGTPGAALGSAVGHGPGPASAAPGVRATVTWDGVGVGAAGAPSTAFPIGAGQSVDVRFNFTEALGAPTVTNASLTLYDFGIALTTESIVPTSVTPFGAAQLNWSFGSLIYLTEGVYELVAELRDANGTALFQEGFYVNAQAPYFVLSAIVVLLIVLGIVEALWIRTLLRYRLPRRRRPRP
jgi:hypothetical protein